MYMYAFIYFKNIAKSWNWAFLLHCNGGGSLFLGVERTTSAKQKQEQQRNAAIT